MLGSAEQRQSQRMCEGSSSAAKRGMGTFILGERVVECVRFLNVKLYLIFHRWIGCIEIFNHPTVGASEHSKEM